MLIPHIPMSNTFSVAGLSVVCQDLTYSTVSNSAYFVWSVYSLSSSTSVKNSWNYTPTCALMLYRGTPVLFFFILVCPTKWEYELSVRFLYLPIMVQVVKCCAILLLTIFSLELILNTLLFCVIFMAYKIY